MYPDLLGQFILTLIGKGYQVNIFRDFLCRGSITIRITSYASVIHYTVHRSITEETLRCMSRDTQKMWFDNLIEWAESEFKKVSI